MFAPQEHSEYHGTTPDKEVWPSPNTVFPMQALSSHPRVFVMILWESMNFHSDEQLLQPLTLRLQVQRSPATPQGTFTRGNGFFCNKIVLTYCKRN